MYKESKLTGEIIGIAMKVHREIGPGFQEKIYHRAMIIALENAGYEIESEKEFNVLFRGTKVGTFRVDLLVEDGVVVELKAVVGEAKAIFKTQTISYLKASGTEVGLLINFGNRSIEVNRLARYQDYKNADWILQ